MATILITGANKGIGLPLTRIYAARDDTVLTCCRNPDMADALKALGGNIQILQVDIGETDSVNQLAKALEGQAIDILINLSST